MKYCSHCGKELMDEAVICPYCGYGVKGSSAVDDTPSTGLNIISFLFPLIGLILYIVYNEKAPEKAKEIGKWAIIGFVVGLVFSVFLYI